MRLILLITLSLSCFAQTVNPDALFLSEAQLKRLDATQSRIEFLKAQMEIAQKTQENEILKIQLECGATPDKYESLALIEGKLGFRRKAEPPKADIKPDTDAKPADVSTPAKQADPVPQR